MRTNSKTVQNKVEKHIFEFMECNEWHEMNDIIESMEAGHNPNNYKDFYDMGIELVENGFFLIYYDDVVKEVAKWTGTKTDKKGREYTGPEAWRLYKHLIAKQLERMVQRYKNNK